MSETEDRDGSTAPGADDAGTPRDAADLDPVGTDGVAPDRDAALREPGGESDPDDWEAHGYADDIDLPEDVAAAAPDDDADHDHDHDEQSRVTAWLSARADRFRQTTAERRQTRAGEASASAAVATLRERGADEPVPTDLTAAAFFDVDNTLVHGASIVLFARGLAARNYFSYRDVLEFGWMQAKFRISGKENAEDVASGRERALSFIAGRPTSELVELGEEIYDEIIADKIWPGTLAMARRHLDAGQQVWLVTATPVELAQTIAKKLGFTGALGTVAESVDGVFTGRLVGDILHGPGKAHAVRTLAIREGLNLKRCTAYSDSHNDVPMLSLVGTAVAINPDADLRDVAKVRGWEIYDFRTARKAAKYGASTALALGIAGGAVAGAKRLWETRLRPEN